MQSSPMGATHFIHTGAASFNPDVLEGRNFTRNPWNGMAVYGPTGKVDSVYKADLFFAVQIAAGDASDVILNLHHVYLAEEVVNNLRLRLAQEVALGLAGDQTLIMRIADSLAKHNTAEIVNNGKARLCLDKILGFISSPIQALLNPIIESHTGQNLKALKDCVDYLNEYYPATPYQLLDAYKHDAEHMGVASTQAQMTLLIAACQINQARQTRGLYHKNPAIQQHIEGLAANQVAIVNHNNTLLPWRDRMYEMDLDEYPEFALPLILPYHAPLAQDAVNSYNVQCEMWMTKLAELEEDVAPPAPFEFPLGTIPVRPVDMALIDPQVIPMTSKDWATLLRDKTESATMAEVYPCRQIIVQALAMEPVPSLNTLSRSITTYIQSNPMSDNHAYAAYQAAQTSAQRSLRANNATPGQSGAEMSHLQAIHAIGYAAAATGGDMNAHLTNEELGAKRRIELMAGSPGLGGAGRHSCHFWGLQGPANKLGCGKELATGQPCLYAQYHDPNTTDPPAKLFIPGLIRGPNPAGQGQYLQQG